MTRTFLAAAALAAATAFASTAAQACLSCEYVPEVVRPHATSPLAYGRGNDDSSHSSSGSYHGYSVKRRVAKSVDAVKALKLSKAEKSEPKVAKVEKKEPKVAKVERAEPVKVAKTEPVAKKETVAKKADSESSSITIAAAEPDAKVAKTETKETAAKPTDCKKFFASVGMTLTVPCE